MRITFLGQCGFILDFNGARIVTDPHLSDYVDQTCYTESTPWVRLYPPPTTLAEIAPDGILISHSHEDHMDPWTLGAYLAAGGASMIAAPAPECAALASMGALRIQKAKALAPFCIRNVRITPIPCAHTELHQDEAGDYRELSYFIEGDGVKVFFGGDMSLYDGLTEILTAEKPDVVLLPANGRDEKRTASGIIGNIDEAEAARLAAALGALYIPAHWDLFAINGCPEPRIRLAANQAGARLCLLHQMESVEVPAKP